jgi:hypothetical protein
MKRSAERSAELVSLSKRRRLARKRTLHTFLFMQMLQFLPRYRLSSVAMMPLLTSVMRCRILQHGGMLQMLLRRLGNNTPQFTRRNRQISNAIAQWVIQQWAMRSAAIYLRSAEHDLLALNLRGAYLNLELALSFGCQEAANYLCEFYDEDSRLNSDMSTRALQISLRWSSPIAVAIRTLAWLDKTGGYPWHMVIEMRRHLVGNSPCTDYAMHRLSIRTGEPNSRKLLECAALRGYHRAVVGLAAAEIEEKGYPIMRTCALLENAARICSPGAITMLSRVVQMGVFKVCFFDNQNSVVRALQLVEQAKKNGVIGEN